MAPVPRSSLLRRMERRADDYDVSQKGLLYLFVSEKAFLQGRQRAERAGALGIASEVLCAEEVAEIEPAAGRAVIGGIRYVTDTGLDPAKFMEWLAGQASLLGVRIMTRTEVFDFRLGRNRVTSVLTTRGSLQGGM